MSRSFYRSSWGIRFGTRPVTISFDVKALDDYEIPEVHIVLNNGTALFKYVVSSQNLLGRHQTSEDGWQRYAVKWRATWSDETARRNGWTPNVEHANWSDVIKNPGHSYVVVLGGGTGDGDQTVGIDNFRITQQPQDAILVPLTACARPLVPSPPVVDYTMDAGSGDTLRDRSGHDAHGKIQGAA